MAKAKFQVGQKVRFPQSPTLPNSWIEGVVVAVEKIRVNVQVAKVIYRGVVDQTPTRLFYSVTKVRCTIL